jgi:hypothetical protein
VCDDPKRPTWEQDEAVLACQGLGTFTDASSGYGRHFISTQSVVEVDCHGGEATLSSCSMRYRDGRSPCVAVVLTCHGEWMTANHTTKQQSVSCVTAAVAAEFRSQGHPGQTGVLCIHTQQTMALRAQQGIHTYAHQQQLWGTCGCWQVPALLPRVRSNSNAP